MRWNDVAAYLGVAILIISLVLRFVCVPACVLVLVLLALRGCGCG